MSKAAIVVNRLNECVNFLSLQILLSFELLSFLGVFLPLFSKVMITLPFNLKSMLVNLRLRMFLVAFNFSNFFQAAATFCSGSFTVMPCSMSSRMRFQRRPDMKLATLTRLKTGESLSISLKS